ncbi:MAG: acyl-ACP--UDP-N-acetylglucosamine O-acyltransferase [Opitutales bacterium]|nr:acyl-ACP--UDP-N-acetylglucosamine O-acyltransferase [Opitutales bacterium]
MNLHPTAIIEKGATLDPSVTVGAYAYIGPHVTLGAGCCIEHHATIDGYTTLGKNNHVYPYSFLGAQTHDLKYKGGVCSLKIGNDNTFREYVSIHTATSDGEATLLGDRNYILACSHIGHDCCLGNDIIMSAKVATGGHVRIEDHANIGGHASIHQFCHIGAYSMVAGHSFLKKDLLPFMIASGSPAVVKSYNRIGMMRKGFTESERTCVKQCFKIFYTSSLNRSQGLERVRELVEFHACGRVKEVLEKFWGSETVRGWI